MKINRLLFFLSCLFMMNSAYSQSTGISHEILQQKLSLYSKIHPSSLLFVHTDKTLYTNNETVWFAAYLLRSELTAIEEHTVLSVSLIREDNRKIEAEAKYVMSDGLGSGSFVIPDTIPPGNYLFNAFTNVLDKSGKPLAVFSQSLTIKSIAQRSFEATLSLIDTAVVNGMVRAKVMVSLPPPNSKEKSREKPRILYSTGSSAPITASLQENNSALISIPASQLTGTEPVLLTTITYKQEPLYLSLKLPKMQSSQLKIRFFPEGGNLSEGLESTVAMEVMTGSGLPAAISGILLEDDRPIDTLSTSAYGITSFRLKPKIGSRYFFKVQGSDSLYILPAIIENSLVLHLPDAVVNDTLKMILFSKQVRKVQVAIHNYKEDFAFFETEAKPEGKKLSLVLPALPKGIATITILDEQGRPLAERLFFAHYDEKITAAVKTEKTTYNKRDSVQVTLSLKDKMGKPVQGLVSVAAVQDNRVEGAKQQDIESYVYLNNDLGNLPRYPQGRGFNNKTYLEEIFLVRGWRKYTWQEMMQSKEADTVVQGEIPKIRANLLFNGKALKKPSQAIVLRDSVVDVIITENDGGFLLPEAKLRVTEGRKVMLMVNEKYKAGYSFQIDDPFPAVSRLLAGQAEIVSRGTALMQSGSKEQELREMQQTIILQDVTITGKKSDESMYVFGQSNVCGDYVCEYGALNCIAHTPGNSKVKLPVKGEKYRVLVRILPHGFGEFKTIIYQGCTAYQQAFGIYTAREFYGLDRDPASGQSAQYLSTLFWKPGLITNEKGELSFSFFTGDITGKFRIVVQGVGLKDMIFGESSFMVK